MNINSIRPSNSYSLNNSKTNKDNNISFNETLNKEIKNTQNDIVSKQPINSNELSMNNKIITYNKNRELLFNTESKNTLNKHSIENDNFGPELYNSESYYRYTIRDTGEKVFDLTEMADKFENKLAFPDVEVTKHNFKDGEATTFNAYFIKPGDSNELTRVNVDIKDFEYSVPMDEEKFKNTVGKAMMLIDKKLSLIHKLGDVVPEDIGTPDFQYNKSTGELDFNPLIDSMKNSLKSRINGTYPEGNESINYSVDEQTLQNLLKEFEDFVLKIGLGSEE
ncbi:hypothetical protein [Tepidibacter formicigenes]|jgi:hypothetical protein|uniref:Uncharacterized protein n=1 Tax=Tepidibacter formicigenes DSM 15518 TaxID=1123349 RepID=A0A1M6SBE0_9FIRM|nr:hypothetical protein [Tepidibacter formicigenes]SHK42026.1 hypothetical protein SAMN02744037_02306 [Tepidibacter formicigenes DSM 15518]